MKAYLIDPAARSVTEVEVTGENAYQQLHSMYALLGCDTIEAVVPADSGTDVLYLDEEGKRRDRGYGAFLCRLFPHDVLVGRGLWLGVTGSGDNAPPQSSLAHVTSAILFLTDGARAAFGFEPD